MGRIDGYSEILAPRDSEKVYAIAAQEFQKFYREVTGRTLPIVYEPGADGRPGGHRQRCRKRLIDF